ncbi:MAG: ATP synthase subunit I [Proteobacteria bacterium]|nr:ATP synthase subunit I [Pseudomonadota bacterium]
MFSVQQRILEFVTKSNWFIFAVSSVLALVNMELDFALGILTGGLIVTLNFHLLARTLKKSFSPSHLSSHNVILAKYYIRFALSGFLIFGLISRHVVDPLGLLLGLSVVVVSITLATMCELTKHLFREAV